MNGTTANDGSQAWYTVTAPSGCQLDFSITGVGVSAVFTVWNFNNPATPLAVDQTSLVAFLPHGPTDPPAVTLFIVVTDNSTGPPESGTFAMTLRSR